MPDLTALADLGRASLAALWLPVGIWTVLALVAEAALRLGRSRAALALPVRGAVLAALPLSVGLPAMLAVLAPEATANAVRWTPAVQWLPGVVVGDVPAAPEAAGPPLAAMVAGVGVWLALGLAVWSLLRLARSMAEVSATRRHLRPADAETQAAVDRARQRLGVARPVGAAVAPPNAAPFTLGWRRPLVALPPGLGPEARDVAAVHEMAHVRHGDYGWHLAQRAVTAVFGWHPLAWVLARGLDLDRERAADAAVLAACPGRRRTYADLLFSYAALPAPSLALGAVGGSSILKSRIDAMSHPLAPLHARRLARWGRLGGALVLVLAAGLAATASPSAPAPDGLLFQLVDPVYEIDGQLQPLSDGSMSESRFRYYVLDADGIGRFVVSTAPFPGSAPSGRFETRALHVQAGGHRLTVRSAEALFPDGGAPRVAHVRFDAPQVPSSGLGGRTESLPHTLDDLGPAGAASPMGALLALVATEALQGRVTDADSGAPISGASVVVVGTTVGAATGPDGRYRLDAPAGDHVLRVSASGYEPRTVRLADGRRQLDVALTVQNTPAPSDAAAPRGANAPRPEVFDVAEVMPELVGGLPALAAAIVYPADARAEGAEGTVVVQFVVLEDGSVTEAEATRSPDARLSRAAVEAVRQMRFVPGRQRGRVVKVRYAVPVTFRLPAGEDQGMAQPAPERPSYSGVDLDRLTPASRAAFTQGLRALDGQLDGDVRMTYLIDPDGTTRRFRVESGPRELHEAVVALARALVLREDARPGAPVEGRLRVWSGR